MSLDISKKVQYILLPQIVSKLPAFKDFETPKYVNLRSKMLDLGITNILSSWQFLG